MFAICTYNPDATLLEQVINSCDLAAKNGRIVVIDNGSTNAIPKKLSESYNTDYILCEKPGIAQARFIALKEQQSDEILIFVDDDNVLGKHFATLALKIANTNPHWGVFGGKLLLPKDYLVAQKFIHFLPYLAIKDLGDFRKEAPAALHWNELEPPGGGMCIRPEVSEYIVEKFLHGDSRILSTGAIHAKQFRGEDSYIARQAHYLSLSWGYSPELFLEHKFKRDRMSRRYLYQLLFRFGVSDVYLHSALDVEPLYAFPDSFKNLFGVIVYHFSKGPSGLPNLLRALGQFYANKFLKI